MKSVCFKLKIPLFFFPFCSFEKPNKKYYKTIACFDVYNIETALPEIDLDAIETHLKRANEEERRVSFVNLNKNCRFYCILLLL